MPTVAPEDCKMSHSIHTSERKSFRGCRRRWDWVFHEKWYPNVTAKPLEFGSAFHKAMEVYYEPSTWHMDRQVVTALAIQAFVDMCEAQKKEYLAVREDSSMDAEVEEDYAERVELGIGMLKYFATQVSPKLDTNWKPVKVEVGFEVPIHDGNGTVLVCQLCGSTITYGGRIDCLAEDQYGDYWIVDWKTAAAIRDQDEHLYLDDQIASYCWALRELNIPVRGFIYHEQRKAFPSEPKMNKTTRLGRRFSVNKQEPVEYESYLEAVKTQDTEAYEAGLYDEHLEWLKVEGPKFYARYQIHKSNEELRQTGLNIFLEASDMTDPNLRIYPSAGRFSCGFCAFRQPCMGKNNGEDYMFTLKSLFTKRKEHYWEDKQPSTESKGGE